MVTGGKTIYDEASLVALLKKRDRPAFEHMYRRYSSALLGILLKAVENEEIANDLLQEVFIKIWKNIDAYLPERGRLYTWMLNIARNTGIDYLRSKQSKQDNQNQTIDDVVYHVDRENQVSQQVDMIGIRSLVERLPPGQQLVLEYVYFKGYTQEDASRELNIPLGTVKTRIRAAILELRKEFKEDTR